jgi:hypothetical protein
VYDSDYTDPFGTYTHVDGTLWKEVDEGNDTRLTDAERCGSVHVTRGRCALPNGHTEPRSQGGRVLHTADLEDLQNAWVDSPTIAHGTGPRGTGRPYVRPPGDRMPGRDA